MTFCIGGIGSNKGGSTQNTGGASKRTIQVRTETELPTRTETIVGGRVVGGDFVTSSGSSQSTSTGTGGTYVF